MRLLMLGGSQFLGRHAVEIALARGHEVTVFTRGRRPVPPGAKALVGDRDPREAPGIGAIERGEWDAVIDTSGYVPRIVQASAAALAPRVARYVFVSSVSAYAKLDRPGLDEDAPLATLSDPDSEDIPSHYGALKAACEAAVTHALGSRATIVRPGLIVGPHDATDRFGYWPARFAEPQLLGDRGDRAVVPGPPERLLQFIDGRDLAGFLIDLAERDRAGTFNATSPPGQWTFGDLVASCVNVSEAPPSPLWVSDDRLLAFHVVPWLGLPLWIPGSDEDSAGFQQVCVQRARDAGLRTRPLADTVRDTSAWLLARDNAGAWKQVLTDSRERQIVSSLHASGPPARAVRPA